MDVFVVSHTHWDREWYHGATRFRQRLVELVDELLDSDVPLAPSFLLDGQAIVLEDYLTVRPERRAGVAHALADGRLEAGPWYVLADELLPGGESHVRNLLAGRAILRGFGALAPPVLYSPDAFGHAAALPRLAHGFGFPVAIIWRGYGGARWPAGDTAWWEADGGERVLIHHLAPDGYEIGSNLPSGPDDARRRWTALRGVLAPRARLGLVFIPNGADHHALQADASAAIAELKASAAPDDVVRWTSLRDLARTLAARAGAGSAGERVGTEPRSLGHGVEYPASIPVVHGELRDSYGYTWTLQGTFATRTGQKRRVARAERALVRDAEPWLALSAGGANASSRALLDAAWRTLLRCQPRDTLCGCSIDDVARAMNVRLRSVRTQAAGLRTLALNDMLGHDPAAARGAREAWQPALVVRNASARPRGGVAEVVLAAFAAHVPVGPHSSIAPPCPVTPALPIVDGGRVVVQAAGSAFTTELVESPRDYPDCDLVLRTRALAWLPPQDGYTVRTFTLGDAAAVSDAVGPVQPATGGARWLDNGLLRVEVAPDGRVDILGTDGRRIHDFLGLEDVGDRGDCYTHSARGPRTLSPRPQRVRVLATGPLRSMLVLEFDIRVPARESSATDIGPVVCPVSVALSLDAGSPVVRAWVRGTNRARDHRLRLVMRTGMADGATWADAAFGPVLRTPVEVPVEDALAEQPPPTAPLHRYVSRYGMSGGVTIYSDGLAEYEVLADGGVAVTLVRAVGQLSRADLPERPGHAGWPADTPAAQSPGAFAGRFAVLMHGARDAATVDLVERTADDVLLPLRGYTLRSSLTTDGLSAGGATLAGMGLAMSAIKPADDAHWRLALRCVNLLDLPVQGSWTLGFPVAEACLARLDETPIETIHVDGQAVRFLAGVRAVVTILVR